MSLKLIDELDGFSNFISIPESIGGPREHTIVSNHFVFVDIIEIACSSLPFKQVIFGCDIVIERLLAAGWVYKTI